MSNGISNFLVPTEYLVLAFAATRLQMKIWLTPRPPPHQTVEETNLVNIEYADLDNDSKTTSRVTNVSVIFAVQLAAPCPRITLGASSKKSSTTNL